MPKLPRLYRLVGAATDDLPAVPVLDRVLDGHERNRCIEAGAEKSRAVLHLLPPIIVPHCPPPTIQPPHAAVCEVCAWRMQDCSIPAVTEHGQQIALDVMRIAISGRQQVARPSVMTE
jgi:hypothetical protein